jgi:hypothetical protein
LSAAGGAGQAAPVDATTKTIKFDEQKLKTMAVEPENLVVATKNILGLENQNLPALSLKSVKSTLLPNASKKTLDLVSWAKTSENPTLGKDYVKGEYQCVQFATDFVNASRKAGFDTYLVGIKDADSGHALVGLKVGDLVYTFDPNSYSGSTKDQINTNMLSASNWMPLSGNGVIKNSNADEIKKQIYGSYIPSELQNLVTTSKVPLLTLIDAESPPDDAVIGGIENVDGYYSSWGLKPTEILQVYGSTDQKMDPAYPESTSQPSESPIYTLASDKKLAEVSKEQKLTIKSAPTSTQPIILTKPDGSTITFPGTGLGMNSALTEMHKMPVGTIIKDTRYKDASGNVVTLGEQKSDGLHTSVASKAYNPDKIVVAPKA